MTKKQTPLSDRELRQALAGLREDVAAPADFRAKLMQRLQREGIVAPPAPVAQPGAWRRLAAFLSPARLGFAASAALALVLVWKLAPKGAQPVAVQAQPAAIPSQAASIPQKPAAAPVLASKRLKKPVELAQGPKAEPLPEAFLGEEQTLPGASAPVLGGEAASAASDAHSGVVTGETAAPKPTVVVVHPTATPMGQALDGNSQLRGNVVRASRGEEAVLLYRVQKAGHVHVELFNRLGQSVAVLRDAEQSPGIYDLRWGGGADKGGMAATGIYVLTLETPDYHVQHKLMLVK